MIIILLLRCLLPLLSKVILILPRFVYWTSPQSLFQHFFSNLNTSFPHFLLKWLGLLLPSIKLQLLQLKGHYEGSVGLNEGWTDLSSLLYFSTRSLIPYEWTEVQFQLLDFKETFSISNHFQLISDTHPCLILSFL